MYTYLSSNWLQENGHTKVKVQFPSWPQITRWSVHKYIHNVTKVMCALYVRCALSVLQKECTKVWGTRYMLGARYRSENTVVRIFHSSQWMMLMMKKGSSSDQPNLHSDNRLCPEISGSEIEYSLLQTQNVETDQSQQKNKKLQEAA